MSAYASSMNAKNIVMPLVTGIIMLFIGLTGASIAGGIGQYVVQTLNKSLGGGISINMFNSNIISLLQTVFVMIGIALIVVVVAQLIRSLWGSIGVITGGQKGQ